MAEQNQSVSNSVLDSEHDIVGEPDERHIEAMKERVKEMEAEAAKLREMQASAETQMGEGQMEESKEIIDSRSVFVGNVDYGATPEEIQAHFQSCGTINRVTILCDKWTGHPKGYAYVEFADSSLVSNALFLNDSLFRGRLIKVTAKRTNLPGFMRGVTRGRGRGGGGGGFHPYAGGFGGGFRGGRAGYRGVRGGYRGRRGYYAPY